MKESKKGGRQAAEKIEKSLKKLKSDFHAFSERGINLNVGAETYTPWIDAIELWDYLGDKNEKNKS